MNRLSRARDYVVDTTLYGCTHLALAASASSCVFSLGLLHTDIFFDTLQTENKFYKFGYENFCSTFDLMIASAVSFCFFTVIGHCIRNRNRHQKPFIDTTLLRCSQLALATSVCSLVLSTWHIYAYENIFVEKLIVSFNIQETLLTEERKKELQFSLPRMFSKFFSFTRNLQLTSLVSMVFFMISWSRACCSVGAWEIKQDRIQKEKFNRRLHEESLLNQPAHQPQDIPSSWLRAPGIEENRGLVFPDPSSNRIIQTN